ncbi:4'-phosphopantetheinyl transferase family protein [Vibrio vulnificus]|uniref:4'-phosphopantetheinyl transferase family protein n=1 Tax=Vibrio vulnificus TaxID=672 RepID=UPI00324274CB
MLTSITQSSAVPFIRNIDIGYVNRYPSVRYCKVIFDSHQYQDALFDAFSIPFSTTLNSAVLKRKAEYLAGRFAAKLLLKSPKCYGRVGTTVDGCPTWPSGWCGSLSHTNRDAIALVTSTETQISLGVDIEELNPAIMRDTANYFTSPEEQELLSTSCVHYEIALSIVFSAKESLYKALYPKVGHFFGFDTAIISNLDLLNNSITLQLTQPLAENLPKGAQFDGYFKILDGKVISWLVWHH